MKKGNTGKKRNTTQETTNWVFYDPENPGTIKDSQPAKKKKPVAAKKIAENKQAPITDWVLSEEHIDIANPLLRRSSTSSADYDTDASTSMSEGSDNEGENIRTRKHSTSDESTTPLYAAEDSFETANIQVAPNEAAARPESNTLNSKLAKSNKDYFAIPSKSYHANESMVEQAQRELYSLLQGLASRQNKNMNAEIIAITKSKVEDLSMREVGAAILATHKWLHGNAQSRTDLSNSIRILFHEDQHMPYILADISAKQGSTNTFLLKTYGIDLTIQQQQQMKAEMLQPLQTGFIGNFMSFFTKEDPELQQLRNKLDKLENEVYSIRQMDLSLEKPHPLMLDIRTSSMSPTYFFKNSQSISQLQFFNNKSDLQGIVDKAKLQEYISRNEKYIQAYANRRAEYNEISKKTQVADRPFISSSREPITWREVISLPSPTEKAILTAIQNNLKQLKANNAHGNTRYLINQLEKAEKQLSRYTDLFKNNQVDLAATGIELPAYNIRLLGLKNNPALASAIEKIGSSKDLLAINDQDAILRHILKIESLFNYEIPSKLSHEEGKDFKKLVGSMVDHIPASFLVKELVSQVEKSHPNPFFTLPTFSAIKNIFGDESTRELQQEVVALTNQLREIHKEDLTSMLPLDIRFNGIDKLTNSTQEHLLSLPLSIDHIENLKNRELLHSNISLLRRNIELNKFVKTVNELPEHEVRDPSKPNIFDTLHAETMHHDGSKAKIAKEFIDPKKSFFPSNWFRQNSARTAEDPKEKSSKHNRID